MRYEPKEILNHAVAKPDSYLAEIVYQQIYTYNKSVEIYVEPQYFTGYDI